MPIQTTHHRDTRAHIPSQEEAGYEAANPKTQQPHTELPLNPVTTRGQDPELYWLGKYGPDDQQQRLQVDIRSLYRHEHIVPENLIKGLYRLAEPPQGQQLSLNELFGNALERDELTKTGDYYQQPPDGWSNRLIQGDSALVMASLLEREGMAGAVQCVYFDPPYGIKYGSNWQIRLNNRDVKDGQDESLSGEPEQIKAFRDTWELGIHSYLTYLRERLLLARDLLTESGSCFVQISDENIHLVRCLMDEVFGSENFCSMITVSKTTSATSDALGSVSDFIVWYAKSIDHVKYNQLYHLKALGEKGATGYTNVLLKDGTKRRLKPEEIADETTLPEGARVFTTGDMTSQRPPGDFPVEFGGKVYRPVKGYWKTGVEGMKKLIKAERISATSGGRLAYVRYFDDFPAYPINNVWTDTVGQNQFGGDKEYVVQTANKVIQRCILMTTDPGDLVLDPTCGSGTSAYVAEQWGRRWLTIDTSRIAVNIAKTRLMTAVFPAYRRVSDTDIRHGFVYRTVPHITLKSLANDEPAETETLYDQPEIDKSRFRVAGPFTVETLQSLDPVAPARATDAAAPDTADAAQFTERVYEMLRSAGIRNGDATERAVFRRVEPVVADREGQLHAEGYFVGADGHERKAYIHVGPKFGAVSKQALNGAIKETQRRGDADWLVMLGFVFETEVEGRNMGSFRVDTVRMHDDLMQDGLMKKDKKAAAFVTIGEPDIALTTATGDDLKGKATVGQEIRVEVRGLDLYDPIRDEVKARNVQDIAYWMVDDDYDGSNFVVKQVFFCGGDHDEFTKWKKGISDTAKLTAKKRAEHTLRIELDEEAFDGLYGFRSHPIKVQRAGQQVAVRVVSQFGEESTKVLAV